MTERSFRTSRRLGDFEKGNGQGILENVLISSDRHGRDKNSSRAGRVKGKNHFSPSLSQPSIDTYGRRRSGQPEQKKSL